VARRFGGIHRVHCRVKRPRVLNTPAISGERSSGRREEILPGIGEKSYLVNPAIERTGLDVSMRF
jgi:hypothetical protein